MYGKLRLFLYDVGMESARDQSRLESLNRRLNEVNAKCDHISHVVGKSRRKIWYYRIELIVRAIFNRFFSFSFSVQAFADKWYLKLLLAIAISVGIGFVFLVAIDLTIGFAATGFILGCLIGITVSFILLSSDSEVTKQRIAIILSRKSHLIKELSVYKSRLRSLLLDLNSWKSERKKIKDEVKRIKSSIEFIHRSRVNSLLDENIHIMSGVEFERYLKKVFEHLGARVKETPVSGDQGVDLIVIFENTSIAIQAKRWSDSVGNKAVQEVHTGKDFYQCSYSAVVTNSRFTRSAYELANTVGCMLIDGVKLNQLINGQLELPGMRA